MGEAPRCWLDMQADGASADSDEKTRSQALQSQRKSLRPSLSRSHTMNRSSSSATEKPGAAMVRLLPSCGGCKDNLGLLYTACMQLNTLLLAGNDNALCPRTSFTQVCFWCSCLQQCGTGLLHGKFLQGPKQASLAIKPETA